MNLRPNDRNAITEAIGEAKHKKVLVFAAASNLGNTRGIVFPAILYQTFELFCMFSTTADVKPNCSFNPAPLEQATYNFAILGEGIELPPDPKMRKGTSFSTVIAAGLACQILEFSRHEDVLGEIASSEDLRKVDGMSAVFAKMVSARDNGYHCLAPWKLLGGMMEQGHDEDDIRKEICRTISDALKGRYEYRP